MMIAEHHMPLFPSDLHRSWNSQNVNDKAKKTSGLGNPSLGIDTGDWMGIDGEDS